MKVVNEIEESFTELEATAKDYSEQLSRNASSRIASFDLDSFVTHRIRFIACYDLSGKQSQPGEPTSTGIVSPSCHLTS